MRELIQWLIHDEQKNLYEFLFALVLNILFLAMIALLLWPLGRLTLAFRLAEGYGILWIVSGVTAVSVNGIQRFFRVNVYDHPDAYVISNLAVSCLLQAGWSAFAAFTVYNFVTGVPVWIVVILYLVGVLSCFIAFVAVSSFYRGHIYKLVSLPLALITFLVFSVWPVDAAQSTDGDGYPSIVRTINAPAVRDRLAAQGAEALTSTPEELGRYTRTEMQRWQRVIRESGARAD